MKLRQNPRRKRFEGLNLHSNNVQEASKYGYDDEGLHNFLVSKDPSGSNKHNTDRMELVLLDNVRN